MPKITKAPEAPATPTATVTPASAQPAATKPSDAAEVKIDGVAMPTPSENKAVDKPAEQQSTQEPATESQVAGIVKAKLKSTGEVFTVSATYYKANAHKLELVE